MTDFNWVQRHSSPPPPPPQPPLTPDTDLLSVSFQSIDCWVCHKLLPSFEFFYNFLPNHARFLPVKTLDDHNPSILAGFCHDLAENSCRKIRLCSILNVDILSVILMAAVIENNKNGHSVTEILQWFSVITLQNSTIRGEHHCDWSNQ